MAFQPVGELLRSENNGSMKITCAKCGEELLGAVNRCWKCGTSFELSAGDDDGPPVRRAPIADLEPVSGPAGEVPLMAELAEPEEASTANAAELRVVDPGLTPGASMPGAQPAEPPRATVPVTPAGAESKGPKQTKPPTALPKPRFRISHRYGGWLGALALLLGLASAAFSYHSFWALPGSLAGLAFGIWALAGRRRGAAMVGIIVCCIAFSVSGYRALLVAYTEFMGYSPFDQKLPVEEPFPEDGEPEDPNDPLGDDW